MSAATLIQEENMLRLAGRPQKFYQINYRLDQEIRGSSAYDDVYKDLREMIDALPSKAVHNATSSFIVGSHHQAASKLLAALSEPLDPALDALHVIEVLPDNKDHLK